MSKYISLTAIGKNQIGIVSAITEIIYKEKCSIEDSTMTILYGQFTMILIIKLHDCISKNILLDKLVKYSKIFSLSLFCADINFFTRKKDLLKNVFIVSVYGADRIGIVYSISKYLSDNKVDITDVQTTLSKRNGKRVYMMIIEASFSAKVFKNFFSIGLLERGKSLDVNISISQAESSNI